MLIIVCYFKKICGINQTEKSSHVIRFSSPAHDRAREFPGMIGCFHVAPNLGPTPKSLPAPKFSFGLDLATGIYLTVL